MNDYKMDLRDKLIMAFIFQNKEVRYEQLREGLLDEKEDKNKKDEWWMAKSTLSTHINPLIKIGKIRDEWRKGKRYYSIPQKYQREAQRCAFRYMDGKKLKSASLIEKIEGKKRMRSLLEVFGESSESENNNE